MQNVSNQNVALKISGFLFAAILFTGCATSKFKQVNKKQLLEFDNKGYKNQFTGLLVIDQKTKDTIIAKNSVKYFIPASTTKLFTFYTANKLLGAKIPSLKYSESKDAIYIQGTGDPSWFHPFLKDSSAIEFLRKAKKTVVLDLDNFSDEKFRPGWAWEDYQYYFSPELGPIPFYGNVVTLDEPNKLMISPDYFASSIKRVDADKLRALDKNIFFIPKALKDTLEIPFITSHELTKKFIEEKLNREIRLSKKSNPSPKKTLYGISTDSIYKRMLYESDNFIAEQLMLVASSTLSDTLSFNTAKNYILENDLSNLKQQPRWVDGSGLSRYNLFTPESMVVVLQKLYNEVEKERLFKLLPAWDGNGTIQKPKPADLPFIFAKSGSMGNTYNLGGYLKTKSGKMFVFSFMNNHHMRSSKEVREDMYKVLQQIHENH